VLTPVFLFEKAVHGELRKRGRQLGSGDKDDGHLVLLICVGTEYSQGGIVTAAFSRSLGSIVG
jgi:hypothetical protein